MEWIRSWPEEIPSGRSFVVDELPRLYMHDYDYSSLANFDEDILLLEWDMAVTLEDMGRFAGRAAMVREQVLVAPYRLYEPGPAHWAHRRQFGQDINAWRWVDAPDGCCDYFSFGMIYLPRWQVRAFLDYPAPERGRSPFLLPEQGYSDCRFTDQTFSIWHAHRSGQPQVRIAWDVHPVHLHF